MGDHISNSNLNIKDIINKDIVRKLCDVLDLDFYNITGSNPMFKFHGSMEENKYSVYSNIYSSMKNYKLEFKFTVNYPKRSDILTTEELSSNFSDEELNAVLDKRRDIRYIFIQYLGVTPHGEGIGTQLVNAFIKRVKEIDKIQVIYLHPKGLQAQKFWTTLGFRYVNLNGTKNKNNFFPWYYGGMMYEINES